MNPTTHTITRSIAATLALLACSYTASADSNTSGPAPTPAPAAAPVSISTPAPTPTPAPAKGTTMKKASDLIGKQEPAMVVARLMELATPENTHVIVSLAKQRAYLLVGDEIAIDTPVSTGKRAGMTPAGKYTVLQKDKDHRSNVYGEFVDGNGRTVRSGVSLHIDSAPSGTHYVGAPMKWFMRLTNEGVGMHVGILPGYPASHGCVRLPADIARLIYDKVKLGTPVEISVE